MEEETPLVEQNNNENIEANNDGLEEIRIVENENPEYDDAKFEEIYRDIDKEQAEFEKIKLEIKQITSNFGINFLFICFRKCFRKCIDFRL